MSDPKNPDPKAKRAWAYDNGLVMDGEAFHHTKANSVGVYLARRAHLDAADKLAAEMESKWGCDRLRLLVSAELREKFDRQRYLLNQAVWHGELEDVIRESARMVTAWTVLDVAASTETRQRDDGALNLKPFKAQPLDEKILELRLSDGTVVAICADLPAADRVTPDGRHVQVYLLEEIGRLLEGYPGLAKIKDAFPGATVTEVRRRIEDPLNAFHDSQRPIDEELPF